MPDGHAEKPIAFIDLDAQRRRIGARMEEAVLRVTRGGKYIMGPEVFELERQLAAFCGAKHVLSCSSGTDALALPLMAWNLRPGQAVLCPAFTFAATAEVVAWLGATPVFVDVIEGTFNLDPASLEAGIETAKRLGLKPVGVITVDLFGLPADYDAILPITEAHGLWLLDDAAQGFGASYKGRKLGTFGQMTATSFFPAKPLGCYGDGGAVFLDDSALHDVLLSLRIHGQDKDDKYENVRIGMTARMDTLQAAVLIEKLAVFEDEISARNQVAERYNEALQDVAIVPRIPEGLTSVWAQYTLRAPGRERARILAALKAENIPTAIYYPKPLHRQTAYAKYPVAGNGLPVSERLAAEVFSLPMHPYLDHATQDRIVAATRRALAA
jgi:dTDP-4-amino-4,6-dideoxygalactose transaminase